MKVPKRNDPSSVRQPMKGKESKPDPFTSITFFLLDL